MFWNKTRISDPDAKEFDAGVVERLRLLEQRGLSAKRRAVGTVIFTMSAVVCLEYYILYKLIERQAVGDMFVWFGVAHLFLVATIVIFIFIGALESEYDDVISNDRNSSILSQLRK